MIAHELLHTRIRPREVDGEWLAHPPEFWEEENRITAADKSRAWEWIYRQFGIALRKDKAQECIWVNNRRMDELLRAHLAKTCNVCRYFGAEANDAFCFNLDNNHKTDNTRVIPEMTLAVGMLRDGLRRLELEPLVATFSVQGPGVGHRSARSSGTDAEFDATGSIALTREVVAIVYARIALTVRTTNSAAVFNFGSSNFDGSNSDSRR